MYCFAFYFESQKNHLVHLFVLYLVVAVHQKLFYQQHKGKMKNSMYLNVPAKKNIPSIYELHQDSFFIFFSIKNFKHIYILLR